MGYRLGSLSSNISPQDLWDLRSGIFDEIKHVLSREISSEGSIPLRRTPIDWTPEKGHFLSETFSRIKYPYRRFLKELLIEGFERELQLFAISLDAYIESDFKIPVEKIIYLASLGPLGSSILKKARKELFIRKIDGVKFVDSPPEPLVDDLIKDLDLEDIDTVFNYRHMPMWTTEVNDFLEFSYISVWTNPETVDEFRRTLRSLIKDVKILSEDKRIEILLSSTKSKSLINGKKDFFFLKNQRSLSFSEENFAKSIGKCVRSIIPVQPESFRDAVIVDWKARNTIQFIESRTRNFLQELPYHNFTDDNRRFFSSTRKFYRYGTTFVCRDIRKEGLTKPRYLLKIMLEELSHRDPLLEEYVNFYEDFEVEGFEKPLRGHGQGMANALTTLMQIVIIQMINRELVSRGFTENINALCYNDDCVISVPSDILDEFWDIEGEIMTGLGLLRADSKSFHSKMGYIYCEQYISPIYPSANTKQMVSRRNILFSFLYDFPYEVKEYLSSIANNSLLKSYMQEIVLTFGYEFFPEEVEYPLSLGGWIPDKLYGLSDALLALRDLDYDVRVYCMYKASKCKTGKVPLPKRVLFARKEKESFYERLFPGFTNEIGKYLPSGCFKDLYYKFQLYREDRKLDFLFRKSIQEKRIKTFFKRVKILPSLEDFIKELIPEGKFILPPEYCSFRDPTMFIMDIERDPYKQDTPIENYFSKLGILKEVRSPYREEYSISETNFNFHLRKDERYFTSPDDEQEELLGIPFEEESFYSVDRVVANTAVFLLAHYKYYGRLPVVHLLNEHPYKKEVYNRYLSMEEYIELANLRYDRWSFVLDQKIFNLLERSSLLEEEISELIEESRIIPTPTPRSSESSESDSSDESIPEEEAIRLRQPRRVKKALTTESLQAILLAKQDPEEYEYSEILDELIAPVLLFYNHHDSLLGMDRFEKIREIFSRKFLQIDFLKNLLVASCEEGYLRDIGEALGLYVESSDSEDGLGTLFSGT